MADYRRILGLLLQGHSYRAVAGMVGCSQRDVATARRAIQERGLTRERLSSLSEAELAAYFPDGRSRVSADYDPPDFARVVASMRSNPHFTLLLAWRSYAGGSPGSGVRKYAYSQYCHLFNEYALRHDLVATLHHEPGRVMFVDWAGDTIPVVDAITGVSVKAYLFVAVLPFSGVTFARAYPSMRMDAWLDGHVMAFEHFGGVPQLVVPDNALTATHRKERGDATFLFEAINKRYAAQKSTIITSNKSYGQWHEIFPDSVLAVALLDRLLHHSTTINIRGDSYRQRHRKQTGLPQPINLEDAMT